MAVSAGVRKECELIWLPDREAASAIGLPAGAGLSRREFGFTKICSSALVSGRLCFRRRPSGQVSAQYAAAEAEEPDVMSLGIAGSSNPVEPLRWCLSALVIFSPRHEGMVVILDSVGMKTELTAGTEGEDDGDDRGGDEEEEVDDDDGDDDEDEEDDEEEEQQEMKGGDFDDGRCCSPLVPETSSQVFSGVLLLSLTCRKVLTLCVASEGSLEGSLEADSSAMGSSVGDCTWLIPLSSSSKLRMRQMLLPRERVVALPGSSTTTLVTLVELP